MCPATQKWPTSPKKPMFQGLDSCRRKSPMVWKNWFFFGFFCDVGHFCPSGIGFFGWFGDVGHGKPSLCRPTTRILLCVLPPMPPEGFLFVEPHQGIPALCAPSREAFSVEPHQGVPSFCAPTHGLLKVNGIHQRNPSLCAPTP